MRVLIAGLGRRRGDTLRAGLAARGFTVEGDQDADKLASVNSRPDVVLLDCGVIDAEALAHCRRLRRLCEAPIVAVTQRADTGAWLRGHEAGIDDYLVPPFGLDELAARLRLSVRPPRAAPGAEARTRRIQYGPLDIAEDSRTVAVHGLRVDLRPKEYQLLVVLARQAGRAVAREQLVARLWPAGWDGAGRALEVHVASLRAKLAVPGLVATVRGVGYRLISQESFLRLQPVIGLEVAGAGAEGGAEGGVEGGVDAASGGAAEAG